VSGVENAAFPVGAFEVITLWDVLEHVVSPLETLQQVGQWLAPGGWLLLSVPNVASLVARLMGKRWVLLLREHLWYFSPDTVGRLLLQAGFDLIQTRSKLVQFSLANVLGRLAQYPGALCATAGCLFRIPICGRLRLRFPMGEMDVVARTKKRV
jgi:SAM-dependent methyltransferase